MGTNQNLILISVENSKLFAIYKKIVDPPLSKKTMQKFTFPSVIQNSRAVSIWGLNETKENERIWEKIRKSDIILFLKNGKFFSKGKLLHKMNDQKILENIVKNSTLVKTRKLLLFIKDLEPIDIDLQATIPVFVNPIMPNSYNFPIKIVNDKEKKTLEKTFGSVEKALEFLGNPENKDESVSDFINRKKLKIKVGLTTKTSTTKARKGQDVFSKNVRANFKNKCAVCNSSQTDLLNGGHIVPATDEKTAGVITNGICFCVLCHALFDKGYFSFDDDYRIIFSKRKRIDDVFTNIIHENKKIGACLVKPSKIYLLFHRIKFGIF